MADGRFVDVSGACQGVWRLDFDLADAVEGAAAGFRTVARAKGLGLAICRELSELMGGKMPVMDGPAASRAIRDLERRTAAREPRSWR